MTRSKVTLTKVAGSVASRKSAAPRRSASRRLDGDRSNTVVSAPNARAICAPRWPSPPKPMIPTRLPGPAPQRSSGEYSVMPAQSNGAALASGKPAVAIVGDGSMLMNNELHTAVKYGVPAIWIVLNDGRTLSGVRVAQTDTTLTLADNQGKKQTITKAEIDEMDTQRTSTMPEGLEKRLTVQEFTDLVAYLMSLRATKAP